MLRLVYMGENLLAIKLIVRLQVDISSLLCYDNGPRKSHLGD